MAGQLHQELISVAASWLAKPRRCCLVLTDLVTQAGETPDAIGWYGLNSILVECKASRADFRRDLLKPSRRRAGGNRDWPVLGVERWYLAPTGIIPVNQLPERWGLLEVNGEGRVRKAKEAELNIPNYQTEIAILLSVIRRLGPTAPGGMFCKFYKLEGEGKATVGIEPLPAGVSP